jgi:hypothetical protein
MDQVSVYDHFQVRSGDYPTGTYRVVGVREETVTLLKIGDEEGRREHTGDIITLGLDEVEALDRIEEPELDQRTSAAIKSVLEMGYWSLRVFTRELAKHPIPTAIAAVLVLLGYFDGGILPSFSSTVSGLLIMLGSLSLAYIGSGRLGKNSS